MSNIKQMKLNIGLKKCYKPIAGYTGIWVLLVVIVSCNYNTKGDIPVRGMKMDVPAGIHILTEELLEGEIPDLKIKHITLTGPYRQELSASKDTVSMYIFIKGRGLLVLDTLSYDIAPESIAIPFSPSASIEVEKGEELHIVKFSKKLSLQDLEEMKGFEMKNKYRVYFTKFSECEPYTEKIKSPNTVSRTVLPAGIVPRVSLGTVEAHGPDRVGAHEHPMLEQLFLGLVKNDITVHADDSSVAFKEYSLLHIPLGSSHWAEVDQGKKMYYLWMDFFGDKNGQEWLKTHKPNNAEKDK